MKYKEFVDKLRYNDKPLRVNTEKGVFNITSIKIDCKNKHIILNCNGENPNNCKYITSIYGIDDFEVMVYINDDMYFIADCDLIIKEDTEYNLLIADIKSRTLIELGILMKKFDTFKENIEQYSIDETETSNIILSAKEVLLINEILYKYIKDYRN